MISTEAASSGKGSGYYISNQNKIYMLAHFGFKYLFYTLDNNSGEMLDTAYIISNLLSSDISYDIVGKQNLLFIVYSYKSQSFVSIYSVIETKFVQHLKSTNDIDIRDLAISINNNSFLFGKSTTDKFIVCKLIFFYFYTKHKF